MVYSMGIDMKDEDCCETFMNDKGTYITICSNPNHSAEDGETVIFHG